MSELLDLLPYVEPLVVSVRPMADEAVGDLTLRAAAENSYVYVGEVLKLAGMKHKHPSALGVTSIGSEEYLAKVLGLPNGAYDLHPLLNGPAAGKKNWVRFHGTTIRWSYLSSAHFRVSPLALRENPYLRSGWRNKVISWDPRTGERLLDRCPVCQRKFGYVRTLGIVFCAYCTRVDDEGFVRGKVDYRDHVQPIIQVDDREAVDFMTGLVDPDPVVRSSFAPHLCDELEKFDRGELFEFGVAIACAITSDPSRTTPSLDRPETNEEFARFTPEVLAKAGRAMLDWPQGLHDVADEIRQEAPLRPGSYGIRKELGPLVSITQDPHVHKQIKSLLNAVLRDNMEASSNILPTARRTENRHRDDLITQLEASRRFGCSKRQLMRLSKWAEITVIKPAEGRGPILFDAWQLEDVFDLKKRIVPSNRVAVDLGVPRDALRTIAEVGFLKHEPGPVTELLVGKDYYHKDTVENLKTRLFEMERRDEQPPDLVRISVAVNRLGVKGYNHWPVIIAAILDGSLPVWRIYGRLSATLISLAVADIDKLGNLLLDLGGGDLQQEEVKLTQIDASRILCTTMHNVIGLVNAGLLPKKITPTAIQEFRDRYVLMSDIRSMTDGMGLQMSERAIRFSLLNQGIGPVVKLKYGAKHVWLKSDIDRAMWAASGPWVSASSMSPTNVLRARR